MAGVPSPAEAGRRDWLASAALRAAIVTAVVMTIGALDAGRQVTPLVRDNPGALLVYPFLAGVAAGLVSARVRDLAASVGAAVVVRLATLVALSAATPSMLLVAPSFLWVGVATGLGHLIGVSLGRRRLRWIVAVVLVGWLGVGLVRAETTARDFYASRYASWGAEVRDVAVRRVVPLLPPLWLVELSGDVYEPGSQTRGYRGAMMVCIEPVTGLGFVFAQG